MHIHTDVGTISCKGSGKDSSEVQQAVGGDSPKTQTASNMLLRARVE